MMISSLSISIVVVGPTLVVLIMIVRCSLALTIEKLGKNKGFLLPGHGNYTAHSEVGRGVLERECVGL